MRHIQRNDSALRLGLLAYGIVAVVTFSRQQTPAESEAPSGHRLTPRWASELPIGFPSSGSLHFSRWFEGHHCLVLPAGVRPPQMYKGLPFESPSHRTTGFSGYTAPTVFPAEVASTASKAAAMVDISRPRQAYTIDLEPSILAILQARESGRRRAAWIPETVLGLVLAIGSLLLAALARPWLALTVAAGVWVVLLALSHLPLVRDSIGLQVTWLSIPLLAPVFLVLPIRFLLRKRGGTDTHIVDRPTVAGSQLDANIVLGGKYRLEKELGTGAMGMVYEAVDTENGRRVAVKTMRADLSKAGGGRHLKERFLREGEAAGRLQHPNIVQVYAAGEEDDIAYIVMEQLEGATLETILDRRAPLALAEVYSILRPVCDALDYAHRCGVIHRDIKPANIMVTPEGVKIMDFGIARISHSTMTITGSILGTPIYMSPEQIRGEVVDGRTDIFSLGILLYEMCTGAMPFAGKTLGELSDSIVSHSPELITRLNGDYPPGIDAIVAKMLAKDRTQRYERPLDIVAELRQVLNQ